MRNRSLAIGAWFVLGYTVAVIIFGGVVRATGSGAGCGSHWPLCDGEVLPPSTATATLIEYSHRVTSGLALLLVVALLAAAYRSTSPGSPVRTWATASMAFMVLEALVGAGLVLFEQVAYNVSIARAYWMSAHLINTLLLLAAMTLTAWFASGGPPLSFAGRRRLGRFAWICVGSVLIIGVSGAIAALGDTLVLSGGLDPATDQILATLVALRVYHPFLAICGVVALLAAVFLAARQAGSEDVRGWAMLISFCLLLQLAVGVFNVWLAAPVLVQMLHLFVTDVIWISLVIFGAMVFRAPPSVPADLPPPAMGG